MPRSWKQQVPNFLSLTRIGFAFVFPFLPSHLRLPVILIALLTEFFDGHLARRWDAETALGQTLDPLADKLFVLSTVGTLILEGSFTWTQFALLAMRDIVVSIGTFSVMLESKTEAIRQLKPKLSGKLATTLQFLLLISLFAGWPVARPLFIITAAVSCLSALDYTYSILHRRWDAQTY